MTTVSGGNVEGSRAIAKPVGRNVAIGLLLLSIAITVTSSMMSSSMFLVVPLIGLASIAVSISSRCWWTIILGVVEIAMPTIAIYAVYSILYIQQAPGM